MNAERYKIQLQEGLYFTCSSESNVTVRDYILVVLFLEDNTFFNISCAAFTQRIN